MKLSWNSIKISIAGAKLSHLAQKDSVWDHGSMIEQVKSIFYHVEKAKNKTDVDAVKKYVTAKAYEQLEQVIKKIESEGQGLNDALLTGVSIIEVKAATSKAFDRFTALIKGKRGAGKIQKLKIKRQKSVHPGDLARQRIEIFSERWLFMRQGHWWLLDEIKK